MYLQKCLQNLIVFLQNFKIFTKMFTKIFERLLGFMRVSAIFFTKLQKISKNYLYIYISISLYLYIYISISYFFFI